MQIAAIIHNVGVLLLLVLGLVTTPGNLTRFATIKAVRVPCLLWREDDIFILHCRNIIAASSLRDHACKLIRKCLHVVNVIQNIFSFLHLARKELAVNE